jgi:long-chain acyl-CoA synthetase
MAEMTLPQYLARNARDFPRRPALREKEKGIWQEWTWADYLARVRAIALGLVSLGFQRGDKLALLSDNRPELYAAMVAAEAVGGVPSAIFRP